MRVIESAEEMMEFSNSVLSRELTIGFVPTMGALHLGHASLISLAKQECDQVVVSVFVNPTQFNDKSDLEQYPRNFDEDKAFLEELNVNVMFFPSSVEIYPNGTDQHFELDNLDKTMEGLKRPGHFNGVVQVVLRLFELTKPSKTYFGDKDFQQLAIIKHMTNKLNLPIQIVGCPTLREADGLAMSSRNVRLSPTDRDTAPIIYSTLAHLRDDISKNGVSDQLRKAKERLDQIPNLKLEYIEIVNSNSLAPVKSESEPLHACIAAWLGDVRLIDNVRVN